MGGVAKSVGNIGKGITSSPTRFGTALVTAGGSELARLNPAVNKGLGLVDRKVDSVFGLGQKGGPGFTGMTNSENPAQTLAQTGGAPLLANIALGANVDDTLAGYFGKSDFRSFYEGLSDEDRQLVDGVRNQLTSIQKDTNLKNQAVQQVVSDFPNIVAKAAQARQNAGQEFDDVTKGYLDQALSKVGAKYAANGGLSSGAMAAASARTGADMGLQKLDYIGQREEADYNKGITGWQARYNETNALRNFQNLMTQGAAGQGFSAIQASLNRKAQTDMANAGFANQQSLMDQKTKSDSDNALFGAIGGVAGTFAGGAMFGPAGAGIGGQTGRSAASGTATGGTNYNASAFPQGSSTMNEPFSYPKLNLRY